MSNEKEFDDLSRAKVRKLYAPILRHNFGIEVRGMKAENAPPAAAPKSALSSKEPVLCRCCCHGRCHFGA